jgi:thiamine pyrophosphokinase
MRPAILFAAAPVAATERLRARLAELHDPLVIAADDGATTALTFGQLPHVVIGDLDSIQTHTLLDLERRGVPVEPFPSDKDATDGQLALERALAEQPGCLWLVGFLGGPRFDQALANVLLTRDLEVPVFVLDESNEFTVIREGKTHTWRPEPGEIISLIPLTEEVGGITTQGLRWGLEAETLRFGQTRGISNEPIAAQASVSVGTGRLLLSRFFKV